MLIFLRFRRNVRLDVIGDPADTPHKSTGADTLEIISGLFPVKAAAGGPEDVGRLADVVRVGHAANLSNVMYQNTLIQRVLTHIIASRAFCGAWVARK